MVLKIFENELKGEKGGILALRWEADILIEFDFRKKWSKTCHPSKTR